MTISLVSGGCFIKPGLARLKKEILKESTRLHIALESSDNGGRLFFVLAYHYEFQIISHV